MPLPAALRFPEDVLKRDVGDEAVVLHLGQETYYGLDPVAARMWTVLRSEPTVEAALETLLAEYEVPADRLRADLAGFVAELVRLGLAETDG